MLVTSIFSFFHNVFKSLFFSGAPYALFFGKGLMLHMYTIELCPVKMREMWLILHNSKLLKKSWEKEKVLENSIFSFSHNVFYPSQMKFQFFSHICFVICNAFNLDQSKILSFGKDFHCKKYQHRPRGETRNTC